ncbi:MAG: NCS2 family permease [Pseudomonadota bacterium]
MNVLERYFKLKENSTDLKTELVAGVTTFLTMSYIIFVNPSILENAGMDDNAVLVATCLAAAIGSLIMGLYANLPIALAPGMGLNAYFTYGVVIGMGIPWQTALGAVFLSGVGFVILSLTPAREWIVKAIPRDLKYAMASGIGLFLVIIGLSDAGIIVDNPATLVSLGDITSPVVLLAIACFFIIAVLDTRKFPGAILVGILAITIVGNFTGASTFNGIMSAPPDISPTLFAFDPVSAFDLTLAAVVISLLFVDTFEATGTFIGIAQPAGLVNDKGEIPNLSRAMLSDSLATVAGAVVGTSTTTSYVESVAGVKAGGRTGLTAITVATLFLFGPFFAPLAGAIESYATGAALVYIGCVMAASIAKIDWEEETTYIPCLIMAVSMPLTFSIATGIGFGFISYAFLKIASGKYAPDQVGIAVLALLFLGKFTFLN